MRIGELAKTTGVTAKTVRYYESIGLLHEPDRTESGYRDYGPDAKRRLAFVRSAQSSGLTLAEIRSILDVRDAGSAPCEHVAELVRCRLQDVDKRMAELRRTKLELEKLAERARELDPSECADEDICRVIASSASDYR